MKIRKLMCGAAAGACALVGCAYAASLGDGDFAMPHEVVSAATAFETYMKSAASIDGRYSNGAGVARDVREAAAYEPRQLEEGMIAYGAIVALQDERFVDGVWAAAGRGEARAEFAERLIEDPFAATRIDGADEAERRIAAALAARAAPLAAAGAQMKAASYSVQHQSWSRTMVANAQGRLAEVKSVSASRIETSEADDRAMMSRVAQLDYRIGDDTLSGRVSGVEARSLALAAEAVLGDARSGDGNRLAPLLAESSSAECLKMAKLNLYQCMAVAGPSYEDMYCMGQHAMADTGRCVQEAAGASQTRLASQTYTPAPSHSTRRAHRN